MGYKSEGPSPTTVCFRFANVLVPLVASLPGLAVRHPLYSQGHIPHAPCQGTKPLGPLFSLPPWLTDLHSVGLGRG